MKISSFDASTTDLATVADALSAARRSGDSTSRVQSETHWLPVVSHASAPIRGAGVAAEWVAAPHTTQRGVVIYLHGGWFQRDEKPDVLAARLSAATQLPVLLCHYRLAPQHRYPSAVQDLVTLHQYVVNQGHTPDRVIWVGHAAGATLALSALESLEGTNTPKPAAVIAVSPITDFTLQGWSEHDSSSNDILTHDELRHIRGVYLGDADAGHAPASPVKGAMHALPPLLVACGGAELLKRDATRYAQAAAQRGNDVTLDVFEGMPHGFPLLQTSAAHILMNRIADFVNERLPGGLRPPTDGQALTIRRLGWACFEITTEAGTRIVLDPFFHGNEGIHTGLPETPVTVADVADADIVLVTHAGFDHRAQAIDIAQAGDATLVCGTALAQAAARAGLSADRIATTVSGVEFRRRDVTINSLPARHESTMTVDGQFVADQPQSFLVTTTAGSRIFCGGDTRSRRTSKPGPTCTTLRSRCWVSAAYGWARAL